MRALLYFTSALGTLLLAAVATQAGQIAYAAYDNRRNP